MTRLPGILTYNPSFYWQPKEHSLGTRKGANPLPCMYSHRIQDGSLKIRWQITELWNQKTCSEVWGRTDKISLTERNYCIKSSSLCHSFASSADWGNFSIKLLYTRMTNERAIQTHQNKTVKINSIWLQRAQQKNFIQMLQWAKVKLRQIEKDVYRVTIRFAWRRFLLQHVPLHTCPEHCGSQPLVPLKVVW